MVKKLEKDLVIPEGTESVEWTEAVEIEPSNKTEMLWLLGQLQRLGITQVGQLEVMISRMK